MKPGMKLEILIRIIEMKFKLELTGITSNNILCNRICNRICAKLRRISEVFLVFFPLLLYFTEIQGINSEDCI